MCYDIKVLYETTLKRARRKHDPDLMKVIEEELKSFKSAEYHHVSGYSHPKIPVYTSQNPFYPKLQNWGIIPFWTKDEQAARSIQNKTLNARSESIFEKPAFKDPAKSKRCLIYVDGFYEHHHFKGKSYPYYIQSEKAESLCLAALWDEWVNVKTGEIYQGFSIVTTKGEGIMRKIHNNPKLSEARMPFMLEEENQEKWLSKDFDKEKLAEMLSPKKQIELKAHTVSSLRGINSLGNIAQVSEEFHFKELIASPEIEF